ncbi:MAG: cyclic-di-AMP receptor [Chloroflexota bacterium]
MVAAIVQDLDVGNLLDALTQAGHRATRISSTGGFLRRGNSTVLIAVEARQVDEVIRIIKATCRQRVELLSQVSPALISLGPVESPPPVEVPVGGATIFVWEVEQFLY